MRAKIQRKNTMVKMKVKLHILEKTTTKRHLTIGKLVKCKEAGG